MLEQAFTDRTASSPQALPQWSDTAAGVIAAARDVYGGE